jgi:16S rRNA (cytosine1402-N4)-methyltransferase
MNAVARASEVQMSFEHTPVLLEPVLEATRNVSAKVIVDCTLGGAGHSVELLRQHPEASLIGIDRDEEALAAAGQNLSEFGDRVRLVHAEFSELPEVLVDLEVAHADIVFADFGVSSHQIDTASRGFSFRFDGPLDMRMNPSSGKPLVQVLDTMSQRDLSHVIATLGEERHARRVAKAIKERLPTTTGELADVVRSVVPRSFDGIDTSTRTFQALRMHVNDELGQIKAWLDALPACVAPKGLALAITFHSLEDRAVKRAFRDFALSCICPPNFPVCSCDTTPSFEVVTRSPISASDDERRENPRARSAKLRVARRLEHA